MSILDIFQDIAPELYSAAGQDKCERFIGYATPRVDLSLFKDDYQLAVAYLAADMLAVSLQNAGGSIAGAVLQKKFGDLQVNYSAPNQTKKTTIYGIKYEELRDARVAGITVINPYQGELS